MLTRLPSEKWNHAAAAHLWNRAGFGAAPAEIERLARMSMDEAVAWFVDYEKIPEDLDRPDWAMPNSDRQEKIRQIQQNTRQQNEKSLSPEEQKKLADQRREMLQQYQHEEQRHIQQMRAAWLRRMAEGPRPLQEKLTLFWHGHFATSAVKVRDAYFIGVATK